MDAAIIEKEALQLPETERALLADRLIESITQTSPSIRAAWVKEADERIQAYGSGKIQSVDGPQAVADLRSRFSK